MSDQTQDGPSDFASFLTEFQNGVVHDDATAKLRDAVNATIEMQKKSSVTITVDIVPTGGRMVIVSPKVTTRVPTTQTSAVFFVDRVGDLRRDDPFQIRLPLDDGRSADEGTGEIIDASAQATALDSPSGPPPTDPTNQ